MEVNKMAVREAFCTQMFFQYSAISRGQWISEISENHVLQLLLHHHNCCPLVYRAMALLLPGPERRDMNFE